VTDQLDPDSLICPSRAAGRESQHHEETGVNIHWRAAGGPWVLTGGATSMIIVRPELAIEMITSFVRRTSTPLEARNGASHTPSTVRELPMRLFEARPIQKPLSLTAMTGLEMAGMKPGGPGSRLPGGASWPGPVPIPG